MREDDGETPKEESDAGERDHERPYKGGVRVGVAGGGGAAVISSPGVGGYGAGVWAVPAFNSAFRIGYQFHRNGGVYFSQTIAAGGDSKWSAIVAAEHAMIELNLYGYLGFAAIGLGVATTAGQFGTTKTLDAASFSLLVRSGWNIPLQESKQPHHFFTISLEMPFVFYSTGFAWVPSLLVGWDFI